MSENKPVRIDRAAIERVIQRAAELQTHERDLSDGLAPSEVVALVRALRLFSMTAGLRYSVILNKGVVNTTPFQFFISRFELQN